MTMVELWSEDVTVEHVRRHWRRQASARNAGGVSFQMAIEGHEIPEGWTMDTETEFFLPPNVVLM